MPWTILLPEIIILQARPEHETGCSECAINNSVDTTYAWSKNNLLGRVGKDVWEWLLTCRAVITGSLSGMGTCESWNTLGLGLGATNLHLPLLLLQTFTDLSAASDSALGTYYKFKFPDLAKYQFHFFSFVFRLFLFLDFWRVLAFLLSVTSYTDA
jgi:hypothetical protein